ncbi:hypothetical protein SHTP_1578 [Mycobacterium ulcerans subsp. shinshuense]|uniref:Lipoprotein n=3 Tax=Mycobacterium ulcerans group TaxID=2993898 RepID=A0A1B4Y194_MYCUL|nr:hypothetical protein SHTP_1578 [Mycobacterium ulcerans subsp. shinshuense]
MTLDGVGDRRKRVLSAAAARWRNRAAQRSENRSRRQTMALASACDTNRRLWGLGLVEGAVMSARKTSKGMQAIRMVVVVLAAAFAVASAGCSTQRESPVEPVVPTYPEEQ